jgi:hypothetical protein
MLFDWSCVHNIISDFSVFTINYLFIINNAYQLLNLSGQCGWLHYCAHNTSKPVLHILFIIKAEENVIINCLLSSILKFRQIKNYSFVSALCLWL